MTNAQTSLFASDAVCPTCMTTRTNLCKYDADRAHDPDLGNRLWERRPKGCLNHALQGARPGFDTNGFPHTY